MEDALLDIRQTDTPEDRIGSLQGLPFPVFIPQNEERNILLHILLHIFLLSCFETAFYFAYVSQYENEAILHLANTYIHEISSSCANLTQPQKEVWNLFLESFLNTTQIMQAGSLANTDRLNQNQELFSLAILYCLILLSLLVMKLIYILYNGRHVSWRRLLSENFLLLFFLGLYEFLFFRTIVINFEVTSAPEIDMTLVENVQDTCGLLT